MIEQDEIDARDAEENAISREAVTCCTDPTPSEERGDGPDEGRTIFYCQACGVDLEAEMYAALTADLEGARSRIDRIRAERQGR